VTLGESIWLTITTVEIPGADSPILWVKLQRHGEIPQPDELIQALGQALYNAGTAKTWPDISASISYLQTKYHQWINPKCQNGFFTISLFVLPYTGCLI
jgi:hypothetical protein